jgi:hypothetical protein
MKPNRSQLTLFALFIALACCALLFWGARGGFFGFALALTMLAALACAWRRPLWKTTFLSAMSGSGAFFIPYLVMAAIYGSNTLHVLQAAGGPRPLSDLVSFGNATITMGFVLGAVLGANCWAFGRLFCYARETRAALRRRASASLNVSTDVTCEPACH